MRSLFGVLAILVPSTALRCDLGRAHGISRAIHRGPRASHLRLAEGSDDEDLDARIDSSIEAELRKALSEMPASELVESDRRLMDGLVQDVKQGELRQAESSLDRELASVQGALESKLESKISALEGETMAKIDAAVEALRGANPFEDKLSAAAVAGGMAGALSAEIPAEGLVVVAGGGTALGRELLNVLGEGSSWQLRSLELDAPPAPPSGAPGTAGRVETRPFAPFAPSVLKQSVAGAAAVVVVSAAAGGKGGVEAEGVARLVKQLGGGLRRLVFISQHGTLRCGQLPFSLKNLLGQLDKLRAAEQEITLKATRDVPAHAIVRLGKLEAGPAQGGRVTLSPGDDFDAKTSLTAAAQAVAEVLARPEAVNVSLSVTQPADAFGGVAPGAEFWDDEFLKLVGPELLRVPLQSLSAEDAVGWVRGFAREFLKPGKKLTTPIEVVDVPGGALLRFLKSGSGYDDDDEDLDDDPWASKGAGATVGYAAAAAAAGKPDGALRLVAEAAPFPRVRVCRDEMEPGVVVKEMSETTVLTRLNKELAEVESRRAKRLG